MKSFGNGTAAASGGNLLNHHVVRRGESLAGIAKRYGLRWRDLAQINHLHDPDRLNVKQRLVVPAKSDAMQTYTIPPIPLSHSPFDTPVPGGPATAVAGEVTEAQLRRTMPQAGGQIGRYLRPLNTAMRVHGINTNERRAAFLAQVSVESGQLSNVEENLEYSARRLRAVWPRRFSNDEIADRYAHDPEALANYVYADRLGNGDRQSGDGYRYRGRWLMQTTGRYNYRIAGFENNPEALAEPVTAADSVGRFWVINGLNGQTATILSRGDFNVVSRTVNGGDHGSEERWQAYQRGLRALQPQVAD